MYQKEKKETGDNVKGVSSSNEPKNKLSPQPVAPLNLWSNKLKVIV